jgi:hypothetical protein
MTNRGVVWAGHWIPSSTGALAPVGCPADCPGDLLDVNTGDDGYATLTARRWPPLTSRGRWPSSGSNCRRRLIAQCVRPDQGQSTELPRRTGANQFSMQVHPELASAKGLSAKRLNGSGPWNRCPLPPISDAPASRLRKPLRGFFVTVKPHGPPGLFPRAPVTVRASQMPNAEYAGCPQSATRDWGLGIEDIEDWGLGLGIGQGVRAYWIRSQTDLRCAGSSREMGKSGGWGQ